MMQRLSRFFAQDMAIDLGTANTLVYMKNHGIVIREPSVVAVQKDHRGNFEVLAVGEEAKRMLGRTPGSITAIRPMKDGVISDFDVTQEMLRYFIRQTQSRFSFFRFKPRIIIAVPSGITQVERRAVKEAAQSAGAREVFLIEEPMAAAVGAGLPVTEASGSMIVDIGGGTTEVAVISLAGIVYSDSARIGGDRMDDTIIQFIKQKYNMLIGERTAEEIKINIGSAFIQGDPKTHEVRGRDLVTGIPKTLILSEVEVLEALTDVTAQIIKTVRNALESTPPELAADIVDHGIVLAGGGSLLSGLDELLRNEVGLPIFHAEDPLTSVAVGTGKVLDELDLLSTIELDT
ncbi:MAG: rod shape-determining protein [SAR324 cluster bacterium]|jgi:rod shape-determining protein MreB|nr:rod shape-determining protein [SAR324 cluster bacterium]|tara:strand:+ start:400 stop:1440 length:1041 start_codon:yes stop_codon:yes gene_type:complete